MLKIILINLIIVSSSLLANIERTYKSAANMYLDYKDGLDVSMLMKKSENFYDTKLSLIDTKERQDRLIYLGAEIDEGELFLFEMRFDGSNITFLKKSYRVESSTIQILKGEISYSSKQFYLMDQDIGLWSVIVGNTLISSFNDSEEARRLVFELEVNLNKDYAKKRYEYVKTEVVVQASDFSHMKENLLFESSKKRFETKKCTYYKILNEELPLQESPATDASVIDIKHRGEIVQLIEHAKYSWCKVQDSDKKQVGWIWKGKENRPTVEKLYDNCK